MEEIWKDIPQYEGYYQVSNLGNFRSLDRVIKYKNNGTRLYPGKSLSVETAYDGYKRIVLMKEGIKQRYQAHRLVALAFIPNLEEKPFINHIDGNKGNNVISNLEWCTASENMTHADRTGLRDMSKNIPSNSKMVKCIETGETFSTINRALKWLGKTPYSSRVSFNRGIKRNGMFLGYHWEILN